VQELDEAGLGALEVAAVRAEVIGVHVVTIAIIGAGA